jgi:hypothetical protein
MIGIKSCSHNSSRITEGGGGLSIVYGGVALICLVLLFSPLVGYALCILLIWFLGSNIKQREMYVYAFMFSVSFSIVISSKAFGFGEADDFVNYYQDYFDIVTGGNSFGQVLSRYSFGLEFGLPLLFGLSGFLFPVLTPHQLMFFLSFLFSMLFSSWVTNYTYTKFYANKNIGYIISMTLLLLSLTAGSQLVRQGISLVILLFAITNKRLWARYTLLLIATVFHLTALPLFFISWVLLRHRWRGFFPLLLAVAGAHYFALDILTTYSDLPKLDYIARSTYEEVSDIDIGTLKWLSIALFFITLAIVTRKKSSTLSSLVIADWAPFTFFYAILFVSVIRFPLLPTRISMLVSLMILGYLVAVFVLTSKFTFFKHVAFVLFFTIKFYIMIQSSVGGISQYWHEYNWVGALPGYYIMR